MPRRKSKGNITDAAIAGSKEVTAELSGNLRTASEEGKKEKSFRSNSSMSKRTFPPRDQRKGESRPSGRYASVITSPAFPVPATLTFPEVLKRSHVHLNSSGLDFGTYYTRDPFRAEKTEAIIFEYGQFAWNSFQIQTPTTADASANNVGTMVQNIWQQLIAVINFNGRFTPNQVLTAAADFTTFINTYSDIFSILWTFWGLTEALEINTSTRAFAKGISAFGNVEHAAALWKRLQKIPVPPGLVKVLSELTGVFYSDVEDYIIAAYVNTVASNTVVTDWTAASGALSVDVLLSLCETLLTNIEGNTAESNIITETLAIVYGPPLALPKPYVHSSQVGFDLHFTRASIFNVTTFFVQPSSQGNGPSGTVPVLIRRGYETDPYVEYAFSFLRPTFYDAATFGSHAQTAVVGLMLPANNTQNSFGRYYGPGTANNTIIQDNSFAALNFGNNTFYEVEWWAAFVQSTSGTVGWLQDSRSYDRWSIFYPNASVLNSQSVNLVNKIFFEGMKIKELL